MRASKTQIKLIVLLLISGVIAPRARGVDRFWTNNAGGNFNATLNWFANTVPGAGDNANFTNKASYQVNWTAAATNGNAFFNADSGTVTQAIVAVSWLVTNSYVVGQDSTSTATVTHTSGTLRVTNSAGTARFTIGQGRSGTYNLRGGSVVANLLLVTNNTPTAFNSDLNLASGTLTTLSGSTIMQDNFNLNIGSVPNGTAIWNVLGGTNFVDAGNGVVALGSTADATGELRISGAPTIWTNSGGIIVGFPGGSCLLVVSNGAKAFSDYVLLGYFSSSSSNQAWVAGGGSFLSSLGDVTVGESGSGNLLAITNSAQVVAVNTSIGYFSSAVSNRAIVTGSGSILSNAALVNIGYYGSASLLSITNGGLVTADWAEIGSAVGSTNNVLIVDGSGSELHLRNTNGSHVFVVGKNGSGNRLVVTNGGQVVSCFTYLSEYAGSTNNSALVSGPGSVWTNSSSIHVGLGAPGNRIDILGGGQVWAEYMTLGVYGDCSNNTLVVSGTGSALTVTTDSSIGTLEIGEGTRGNSLLVTNGGTIVSDWGIVGGGADTNTDGNIAIVTGAGSVWRNRTSLTVGNSGSANQLVVSNGGMVLSPWLTLGPSGTSSNNICLVAGGKLYVTNISGTAMLEIRRGTNELDSGVIVADALILTNAAGAVDFNSGSFLVRNSTVTNGQPFIVGDGASTAYLDLIGNGTHTFANGLMVRSNAQVIGIGTINGLVTVQSGGVLEPLGKDGKITLNTPPLLQGIVGIEIRKTGTTLTNGQIQVNGALTYGGSLTISDDSPNPSTAGDRFQLFIATGYSGAFTNLNLPLLPFGLAWTNKLLIDGSIEVVALPAGDRFWTNSLGGNYQYAANWLDWHGPSEADSANFTNNASYQVNWSADAAAANAFFNSGSGTVTQAIGGFSWLLTNTYVVGQNPGSTATVTHTTGTLQVTNSAGAAALIIGQGGSGTYNLQGGSVIADQLLATNNSPTLQASGFNIDFGSLTTLHSCVITQSGSFIIGTPAGQPATWNVLGGTNRIGLTVGTVTLGGSAGSQGSLLVSGLGTLWAQNRGVLVGSNGSLSSLTITNGAHLSATGVTLGSASGSANNLVTVTDTNSLLAVTGSMTVGSFGRGNQLFILNGGVVSNTSTGVLGPTATGDGNVALVSGPGSAWINGSFMNIGSAGASNRVVVQNGGLLKTVGGVVLGNTAGADTNSALITDAGSLWTDTGTVTVGGSIGNSLVISNGGHFQGVSGMVGGSTAASNNFVLITGSGSVWSNSSTFFVGRFGAGASMIVSNGASVIDSALTIGSSAIGSNNLVLVTGIGSVWSNTSSVIVGSSGTAATLTVSNGGRVYAGSLTVGDFPTATNSVLAVGPGNLYGSGSSGEINPLIIGGGGQGRLNLNGGGVTVARLLVTNGASSVIAFDSGVLNVRTSLVDNAQTFFVGNGSNTAGINFRGNGQNSFANGLTIRSNASVTGTGNIGGLLTVQPGATLAPGAPFGIMMLSNPPVLQGLTIMEISKIGAAVTNAQVQTSGSLTFGGKLTVDLILSDPLVGGERFPLFTATSYAGAFSSISLPPLPFGLYWTNNLLVDGSIGVALLTPSDRFWTNRLGGNYQVAANWLNGLGPGIADNASFTNNATYTVNWTDDAAAANAFFDASTGIVTQAAGSFSWLLTNSYVVGAKPGALPSVTHSSGTLRVTNASASAVLEVRRGTNRLNAGLVEADQLLLTNTTEVFEFNGGTLITRGGVISNNVPFSVGVGGSTPAIWDARAGNDFVLSSNLVIGLNVPGCQLLVTNGARIFNAQGVIGNSSSASSNAVLVTGVGSALSNSASFRIGINGGYNQVVISNGGKIFSTIGTVGEQGSAVNNRILITDAGSVWTNSASLAVGSLGGFNQLVISNGGNVLSSSGVIGSSSVSNSVLVTDTGSAWNNNANFTVGTSGSFNQLTISNGGAVFDSSGFIGISANGNNNTALVTGAGSVWATSGTLSVGFHALATNNQLFISAGGKVFDAQGTIGEAGPFNAVSVSGAGSVWSNSAGLFAGQFGAFNQLAISNSGTVLAPAFTIGVNASSTNNRSTVDGGALRVTNAAQNAALDIRRGTNQLNAGLIETDLLRVTNALGRFEFNGGALSVRASAVANSQTFFVGNGVAGATLNLVGNGTHSFFDGLTIRSNAFLIGNGSITGAVTVLNGGTFAPGTSIGKVSLSNSPVLGGTVILEVSKTGSVLTNDFVQISAALNYGGTLAVSNSGPDALALGDRFQVFKAASYSGAFTTLNLPQLAPGLAWDNQLLIDGSLQVVTTSRPQFSQFSLAGTNLIFSGSGGISNTTFTVLSSTNLSLAFTNWVPVFTNQFDAAGNFLFTNPLSPALLQNFYLLRLP